MSFKAQPLPADIEERKRIHAAFNDWLCQAATSMARASSSA